jgi:hypothetical protein
MNSKENEDKFDRVRQNFKAKPPPITQPKPSARKIQVKPMIPPSERDRSPVGSAVNGKKNVTSDDEMAVTDEDLKLNSDSLAQFARVDLDAVVSYFNLIYILLLLSLQINYHTFHPRHTLLSNIII